MTFRAGRLAGGLGCLAVSLLLATSCGGGGAGAGDTNGKINVVSSTDVWGSVASAVGGNAVSVTPIIDSPSEDPHDYESNSEDALKVSEAQLAVSNGGGYDQFFADAVSAAGSSPQNVVAFDLAGGSNDANQHVFYDLPTVEKVASEIAKRLGAVAPDKREMFTTNAAKFTDGLNRLEREAGRIGERHPGTGALATEPVAGYLLDAAGLRDATPRQFAEAVEQDIDVPAQALADTKALITGRKVGVLLNNTQTETETTKALKTAANGAGVPVVGVTETLPPGTTGYLAWMGKAVDDLAAAVHGQPL